MSASTGISNLIIKWAGKEYKLENISGLVTVADLKSAIGVRTEVRPERQKLLNLKSKNGKSPGDETLLSHCLLKEGSKIMMMGSLEKDIPDVPKDIPFVKNDLEDGDVGGDDETGLEHRPEYLEKIQKRIGTYQFKIRNQLREGKKLLVLDIDYTLFDHKSTAETGRELMRPYLHQFLASAYIDYDIVIWSATSMKWIEEKMKLLGCDNNPNYKLAFYVDSLAMISVHTQKYGVIEVKPLGVIWGKFTQFSKENTIMFDDLRRNFLMNPQTGLKIRPFREAHQNRDKDRELLKLAEYLKSIAALKDFSHLKHRKWESYIKQNSL